MVMVLYCLVLCVVSGNPYVAIATAAAGDVSLAMRATWRKAGGGEAVATTRPREQRSRIVQDGVSEASWGMPQGMSSVQASGMKFETDSWVLITTARCYLLHGSS